MKAFELMQKIGFKGNGTCFKYSYTVSGAGTPSCNGVYFTRGDWFIWSETNSRVYTFGGGSGGHGLFAPAFSGSLYNFILCYDGNYDNFSTFWVNIYYSWYGTCPQDIRNPQIGAQGTAPFPTIT